MCVRVTPFWQAFFAVFNNEIILLLSEFLLLSRNKSNSAIFIAGISPSSESPILEGISKFVFEIFSFIIKKNSLSAFKLIAISSAKVIEEILYGFPMELHPIHGKIGINPLSSVFFIASIWILSISPAVP